MKPIRLKMKGLNSFIEEQVIDFDILTQQGLFGIFGPTGSGKSTILDGITLALYGNVARKSANFINANCDKAYVSFEFQISGAVTSRYFVTREYRLDKKTQSPRSGKCKIVDITDGKEDVLADTVTGVTNRCIEIIGLNEHDFTRTVVLPQGKFSDFLKMEGKARRDMLERLFNLYEYGEDLKRKLNQTIETQKNAYHVLLGEAKGLEDITVGGLEEVKEKKKENDAQLYDSINEQKRIILEYEEKKEIRSLQLEKQEYESQKEVLQKQEQGVRQLELELELGRKANTIKPYYDSLLDTSKLLESGKNTLIAKKSEYEETIRKKDQVEQEYHTIKVKFDQNLPRAMQQEEKLKTAIEESNLCKQLMMEGNRFAASINDLHNTLKTNSEWMNRAKQKQEQNKEQLDSLQKELKEIHIDASLRESIRDGERLFLQLGQIQKRKATVESKGKKVLQQLKEYQEEQGRLQKKQNTLNQSIAVLKKTQEELAVQCPGTREDVYQRKELLLTKRQSWLKQKEIKDRRLELENKMQDAAHAITKLNEEKEVIEKNRLMLKQQAKRYKMQQMAQVLRESLLDGTACPVCGSIHHPDVHQHVTEEQVSYDWEQQIAELDVEYQDKVNKIVKLQTIHETNQGLFVDLCQEEEIYDSQFIQCSMEQYEKEYSTFEQMVMSYEKKWEENETKCVQQTNECIVVASQLESIQNNIGQIESQNQQINDEVQSLSLEEHELLEQLEERKKQTKVEDFVEANRHMIAMEQRKEEIEKRVELIRSQMDSLNVKMEETNQKYNEDSVEYASLRGEYTQKKQEWQQRHERVVSLVGEVDNLELSLQTVQQQINEIQRSYHDMSEKRDNILLQFTQANEEYIKWMSQVEELKERHVQDEQRLEQSILKQGFDSSVDLTRWYLSEESIQEKESSIAAYQNQLMKIVGAIQRIEEKRDNREVTDLQWNDLLERKDDVDHRVKRLQEITIQLNHQIQSIEESLQKQRVLIEKKQVMEHRLGILSDLETLFKGKKFVEYVATERLHYISKEASKRLGDITNGVYGLETDEDGRFMIKDFKNGGVLRDASTLSGGETFLTSLALALALSAEIQLKGTAPLELFFLDEGFGTLDDDLLDVVMSSLEKIHNNKLKVGIISHVESVKMRVPVKLIVTPAKTGEGGSKVTIEYS